MTETYAFLAAFTVQILFVSVLHPAWLAQYARAKAEVQLPGWDAQSRERFLGLYRAVNACFAVLGLLLLAWLFNQMRQPGWILRPVMRPLAFYNVAQMMPFLAVSLIGAWYKKRALVHTPPPPKRTASLERRGLFDVVSPVTVFLSVLAYVLLAGFLIAIKRHPVPGFPAYIALRTITLGYAGFGFTVYWLLYHRKKWPLETQTYRMQAVAVQVRIIFYVSIAAVAFMSLTITVRLLHLLQWMPFAFSVYFTTIMAFTTMMMFSLRRQAEADRLAASPAS